MRGEEDSLYLISLGSNLGAIFACEFRRTKFLKLSRLPHTTPTLGRASTSGFPEEPGRVGLKEVNDAHVTPPAAEAAAVGEAEAIAQPPRCTPFYFLSRKQGLNSPRAFLPRRASQREALLRRFA